MSKQGGKKFYEKQGLEKPGKIFVLSAHEFLPAMSREPLGLKLLAERRAERSNRVPDNILF